MLAVRLPDHRPLGLHLVVAVGIVVSIVSAARIFGKVWYYLTLWAWAIALLAVLAAVWTLVQALERRRPRPLPVVGRRRSPSSWSPPACSCATRHASTCPSRA